MHGGVSAGAHDTLIGGTGADILGVAQGNNRCLAGTGLNTLWGGSGNDTMWAGGQTWAFAGSGNAEIHGGTVCRGA